MVQQQASPGHKQQLHVTVALNYWLPGTYGWLPGTFGLERKSSKPEVPGNQLIRRGSTNKDSSIIFEESLLVEPLLINWLLGTFGLELLRSRPKNPGNQ
jgi:hypothetical protein